MCAAMGKPRLRPNLVQPHKKCGIDMGFGRTAYFCTQYTATVLAR